jgi:archaellum biogenesis ATPase FlaH
METSYIIKKIMANAKGKKTHVLLVDSHSEILEIDSKLEAEKFVNILNENSDSGWIYEMIEVKK